MAVDHFQCKINQELLMYFLVFNLHVEFHFFVQLCFSKRARIGSQDSIQGQLHPRESGGILLLRVSGGSVAEDSCDHSGASASSLLLELRDLQGDVHQGSQHHLHKHTQHITSCTGHAVLTHPPIHALSYSLVLPASVKMWPFF